jgi:hypothetical protein
MAPKMTVSAFAKLTCSIVALTSAWTSTANASPPGAGPPEVGAPIAARQPAGQLQGIARILPKLQPFDADEIVVHAERPATLSPTSRASIVLLSHESIEPSFTIRPEPSLRLSSPLDQASAPAIPEPGFAGEVAFAARRPSGFDVGIAQRASLSAGDSGEAVARGAELRVGRRLKGLVADFEQPTWDRPAWYLFAASDGQALTWTPASGNGARDIRLQDRVTIGDLQAGLTIQASGLQASLTYLEREVSNAQRTDKQSFTGIALTMRR